MSARILVVDDVPINVRLLQAKLTAEYFDVVTASDGPSALEVMATEPPDIVLLDVMMPGMTGFEVCRRIKANPRWTHIPVVMVTALDLPEDRVEGLEAGADEFLTKPVDDLALLARVRSLVRLKMLMDEWRMRQETGQRLGMRDDGPTLSAESGEGAEILLVADDDRQLLRYQTTLDRDGHTIGVVAPGADAIDRIQKASASLLIVDLNVQSVDPLRLCSQLRSHEATRHLPILIVGSEADTPKLIKGLELGVNDYLKKPLEPNELRARVRTQIKRKRFQQRIIAMHEASLAMALTDGLTGLYNRNYFAAHVEALLRNAREQGRPLSLMMVDVDHFKAVNDTYGHAAGDEVLQELARRISNGVRGFDLVARLGGEEFVIVMPECRAQEARLVGERLRGLVCGSRFEVPAIGRQLEVTASFGLAQYGGFADSADDLMARADQALYEAKRTGRNRVVACMGIEKRECQVASA